MTARCVVIVLVLFLLGQERVYLPVVQTAPATLYLGDNIIGNTPGIVPGERITVFHISDAILTLEELRYEGALDFDNGERYHTVILGVATHALQGSDKPYPGHPDLFRRRYGRLLNTALGMGDQVVAVNIPWLNWVPEKVPRGERWNAIMAEEAAARGVCFADVWTPMLDCGMDCISDDGYHPNELGYELIKREVEKCF